MSAKPRTTPKDLVLSVPLARRPGAKAHGLPRTVPAVRIPLNFSAISQTCWRCRESAANSSLLEFPVKQGKYREFFQISTAKLSEIPRKLCVYRHLTYRRQKLEQGITGK